MAADEMINANQAKRGGRKKKAAKAPAPPKPQPSQAEIDYGTGARHMPPMLHEMSETSQAVVREGFRASMSNWKTRETTLATTKTKSGEAKKTALDPAVIARLTDEDVTVEKAASNIATHWDRMMADTGGRPDPAWYFGHNRRLGEVAKKHGMNKRTVIQASGAMSPQNDPDSEFKAVSAMSDAIKNRRQLRATEDITTEVSEEQAKKGVKPRLVMQAGARRTIASMTPEDMQAATASGNKKKISVVPGFNVEGFRNAGTNRREGFATLRGDYNAVERMKAAKVHLYTNVIEGSEPDTPLHHEYEMRFGDQDEARKVRQGRELDIAEGRTGSETLRGVTDRVDLYGLAKGGSDPTDPAYHHKILGERGMAVPDTWMSGLLSGQEMHDEPGSPSPAKMGGSQTATTHASTKGSTFMSPAAAKAAGGKAMTPGAAWGMAALAAVQQGAVEARETEAQTNIPPVMLQEMTWVHGRGQVAGSVQQMLDNAANTKGNAGTAGSRIARLTSGTLVGQKELRGEGASSAWPRVEPTAAPHETPGTFSRGYDNPLDTDSVTVVTRGGSTVHPSTVPAPMTARQSLKHARKARSTVLGAQF
jgi:hypothetical protein